MRVKATFFLSLYTCARACVEIMHMETESSTSTCWSNVWPNQPRTQRFSPFPPLSSEEKDRDPGYESRLWTNHLRQLQWGKNCISIVLVLVLASTLISTWHCNLELALAFACLNKKKISFILALVLTLLFVSICFRGEIRDLINALVLASQVTTRLYNAWKSISSQIRPSQFS